MRERIEKTLANLLNQLIVFKGITEKDSKNFAIKHFNLYELNNINATGISNFIIYKSSDGKFFRDIDLQNVNILDEKFINLFMSLLVMNLLNPKIDCINSAFYNFLEFNNQYNEIRDSEFMKEMRSQYMKDGKLKDSLTYSQVMKEMFALTKKDELKNELTLKQITEWDEFCNFFAKIVKLICNLFGVQYKSTLDVKEAHNEKVSSQRQLIETENAKIRQYNEEVGKWVKFAEEFKSDVEIGVGIK